MKNELQGLNHDVGPTGMTLRGPKIYYTRKASGQASARHGDLKSTTFSEDDCRWHSKETPLSCWQYKEEMKEDTKDSFWKDVSLRNEECREGSF